MNSPLKGVRVVDLTSYLAGPACTRTLHDWGAEVIKVEGSYGDLTRRVTGPKDVNQIGYDEQNYGKTTVALDLKTPEGLEVLDKLISTADVFMSSYRAKSLREMGLDYETLHAKYPRLIWAELTGFGDEGPMKDAPGFDMIAYWAMTGLQTAITPPEASLIKAPGGFGDMNTGSSLAGGIAAALYGRSVTGVGEKVTLSLFAKAVWDMSFMYWDLNNGSSYPKTRKQVDYPLMNTFLCKDKKWVYMGIMDHDRTYPKMMKVLGREDLVDDKRFSTMGAAFEHLEELYEILDAIFITKDRAEWVKLLTEAGIPNTEVLEITDLENHPQTKANECIIERTLRDGKTKRKMTTSPLRFGDSKAPVYTPSKPLGADTAKVMKELGYDDSTIKDYAERKLIILAK